MKRLLALVGFLLLLPSPAGAEGTAAVFQQILTLVEGERYATNAVAKFTAKVVSDTDEHLKEKGITLTPDDVLGLLRVGGVTTEFCVKMQWGWSTQCQVLAQTIKTIVQREMETIRIGRRMQAIATSYEAPIVAFSFQPGKLTAAYLDILKVWGITDLDTEQLLRRIRILGKPNAATEAADELASAVEELKDKSVEEDYPKIAAVWRYLYGLKFVQTESKETDPDGMSGPETERRHLFARPEKVEESLEKLLNVLQGAIDPPPRPKEIVLFVIELNDDVSVWASFREPDSTHTWSASGTKNGVTVNANGTFDRATKHVEGTFSGTFQGTGFVDCTGNDQQLSCAGTATLRDGRTYTDTFSVTINGQSFTAIDSKNGFRLTGTLQESTSTMQGDIGFRWNTALQPVFPSILRGTESDPIPIPGGTYPPPPERTEKGIIVQTGGGGLCRSLSGSEGYLCRDRTRATATGSCLEPAPEPREDTIILTPCSPVPPTPGTAASSSSFNPDEYCASIRARPRTGTGTAAASSASARHSSADSTGAPCAPGSESLYPYTILGHACYIRECGQRTDGHNTIPGREPLVSQESTFPWSQCLIPATPSEPLTFPSQITLPLFPTYNPALRIRELNLAYCQKKNRPPLSPPKRCELSPIVSLSLLQTLPLANALSFVRETSTRATDEQLMAAEGMGSDVAATIEREYLRRVSTALEGTIDAIVSTLEQLARGTFPNTLCPLDDKEVVPSTCPLLP